jgi:alpha-galactosidase
VGNDLVERVVSFSANEGLRTEALVYKATRRDFTAYSRERRHFGREYYFNVDGQAMTGRSFVFDNAETSAIPGGKALKISLHDRSGRVKVVVTYAVYDEQPVSRKSIAITNTGHATISLTHLCFEAIDAGPGSPSELKVSGGYGAIPHELFMTGRVSDAAIFLRNAQTGEGMAVINEAPGYLKRTEVGEGWGEGISVMYDTDLFPFERTLKPDETFESAKSSLVLFKDGDGLADSRWVVPSYMSHVVMRRGDRFRPIWLFNTWEPFQRRIDEQTVKQLIPVAARMGIDVFTIDDGWQTTYGSNDDNRKNFPDGVRAVREQLERNGMGLGLWVPLAAISTKSQDYIDHPEWACRDRAGRPKTTNTASGTQAVMCLGTGYRDVALHRLSDLIDRYHPRYLKVDLTTVFNAYGESPGCYASGHLHKTWAESLERIYEALQYIGKQLHALHPDVVVDYTFELWGEKHLIDAALLECADVDWLSNVDDATPTDAGPVQARTLLYQRALSIPAESMLIGNLHADSAPIEERLGVELGSGPVLLGDPRKLTSAQQDWYGQMTKWYKALRERASLLDSFFPLGSWQQPQAGQWDGFARLNRKSDGLIVLFRNGSEDLNAEFRIPAPPGAVYHARSVPEGQELGTVAAAELSAGWRVPFDERHAIRVVELRRE